MFPEIIQLSFVLLINYFPFLEFTLQLNNFTPYQTLIKLTEIPHHLYPRLTTVWVCSPHYQRLIHLLITNNNRSQISIYLHFSLPLLS